MFLVMGLALAVLLLWSLVVTPKVVRRGGSRLWLTWIGWLLFAALSAQALLAEGFQQFMEGIR